MATYNYTRERIAAGVSTDDKDFNKWNIPNPMRVDGSLDQIQLATEIKTAISTKTLAVPGVVCNGTSCEINFTEALSAGEETTLTTTVNAHKNNT